MQVGCLPGGVCVDEDCSAGSVCYRGTCRALCVDSLDCDTSTEECAADGVCLEWHRDEQEAICGDGQVEDGETCDDGNRQANDGCHDCAVMPGWSCIDNGVSQCQPVCGDGEIIAWEECDDGNELSGDGCFECQTELGWSCADGCTEGCGDGRTDGVEECDDGNSSDDDSCLRTCKTARCGDGHVWGGSEQCDDGDSDDSDECTSDCVAATCGDGLLWLGHETCDDGNGVGGDGCSADCHQESNWDCSGTPSSCEFSCPGGQHIDGTSCVSNTRSCSVTNGSGTQEWLGSSWSSCEAVRCDSSYVLLAESGCVGTQNVSRFYRGSPADHMLSTANSVNGYTKEYTFAMFADGGNGMRAIYSCSIGTNHFVSRYSACEGLTVIGLLGYTYVGHSPDGMRQLWRCFHPTVGDHMTVVGRNADACTSVSYTVEASLGYVP